MPHKNPNASSACSQFYNIVDHSLITRTERCVLYSTPCKPALNNCAYNIYPCIKYTRRVLYVSKLTNILQVILLLLFITGL